jgi:hypothetical protein
MRGTIRYEATPELLLKTYCHQYVATYLIYDDLKQSVQERPAQQLPWNAKHRSTLADKAKLQLLVAAKRTIATARARIDAHPVCRYAELQRVFNRKRTVATARARQKVTSKTSAPKHWNAQCLWTDCR